MNNKGQTLVIFVLFVPVLLIVISMIINKGNIYYDKRNMENIAKEAINYGLNDYENIENRIKEYINKNIECDLNVNINDDYIEVIMKKDNNLVNKILGNGKIEIKYRVDREDTYGNNES